MLGPKARPGGVPHRFSKVIFEVFEALGGLGRFGHSVEGLFAWLLGSLAELLSGSWVASGGVLKGHGDVLGDMLVPKMAAKSTNYRRMCGSKRHAVLQRFC